eukprot:6196141-Pleurochrysis_carterae.AAC.10
MPLLSLNRAHAPAALPFPQAPEDERVDYEESEPDDKPSCVDHTRERDVRPPTTSEARPPTTREARPPTASEARIRTPRRARPHTASDARPHSASKAQPRTASKA